ncbi:MAG: hypothetical protein E7570_06790 [Ruminococcaceae bacterium]|nr:hypothetical protein [Oscillospiraceae bacterium]
MKRKNTIIKSMLLSIASLITGFVAIALPFNLFKTLSDEAMQIVFISEIIIYFVIGMIFLAVCEKRKQEKIKNAKRHEERKCKIERVRREWIDIAA